MIINIDVKGLEVVCAAYLSQDKVLYRELREGLDIHADNQQKFNLPSRIIAKIFKFKLLYGAMEYGFANDSDFTFISTSPKFWKGIIEKYYDKYKGIARWHEKLLQEVSRNGGYTSPSGRTYKWNLTGRFNLPSTQIKNYMVQGFGADIVCLARVMLMKRLRADNIKCLLINTVHDSIVIDCESEYKEEVIFVVKSVFKDLPAALSSYFNINFDLEVNVEIKIGNNQLEMEEV